MSRLFLILGGDLGEKKETFKLAENLLIEEFGSIVQQSSLYETEAWGFETNKPFYNKLLEFSVNIQPKDILKKCLHIETQLGRVREKKQYSSRLIDIDILMYEDRIIDLPDLTIPHPRMHLRRFCLEPFCEIAPDLIHPKLGKTMQELLDKCNDTGWVKKL